VSPNDFFVAFNHSEQYLAAVLVPTSSIMVLAFFGCDDVGWGVGLGGDTSSW
jgi:hypothetical protein